MQPPDHVDFRDARGQRLLDSGKDIVNGTLESMSIPLFRRERAELAGENADVRVIDVAIEDVSGDVAVFSLADRARHHA